MKYSEHVERDRRLVILRLTAEATAPATTACS